MLLNSRIFILTNLHLRFQVICFAFLVLTLAGCQSAKPAFNQASQPAATNASTQPPVTAQPGKPETKPAGKISADSAQILLKAAAKRAQMQLLNTPVNLDDDDDDEEALTKGSPKPIQTQKYIRREKEKGNWLSGGFLASGMALLLVALILALIGSGPAGLLAIIGGALFIAGVIFTMVALLSR